MQIFGLPPERYGWKSPQGPAAWLLLPAHDLRLAGVIENAESCLTPYCIKLEELKLNWYLPVIEGAVIFLSCFRNHVKHWNLRKLGYAAAGDLGRSKQVNVGILSYAHTLGSTKCDCRVFCKSPCSWCKMLLASPLHL